MVSELRVDESSDSLSAPCGCRFSSSDTSLPCQHSRLRCRPAFIGCVLRPLGILAVAHHLGQDSGERYFVELGHCPIFCGHGSDEKSLNVTAALLIVRDKDRKVIPEVVIGRAGIVGMIQEAASKLLSLPNIKGHVVSVQNIDPRLT